MILSENLFSFTKFIKLSKYTKPLKNILKLALQHMWTYFVHSGILCLIIGLWHVPADISRFCQRSLRVHKIHKTSKEKVKTCYQESKHVTKLTLGHILNIFFGVGIGPNWPMSHCPLGPLPSSGQWPRWAMNHQFLFASDNIFVQSQQKKKTIK